MKSRFDHYLKEGEIILWAGQPEKNKSNKAYIIFIIVFSLFGVGFASLWNLIVWSNNTPKAFRIFGLVFLFFSAFGWIIYIFLHKFRRSKIHYAITSKRTFIEYWFLGKRIKSYSINSLPKPTLKLYSNGIGTVLINYEKPFSFKFFTYTIEYSWFDQFRRLEYLKNAEDVINLLIEQRKKLVATMAHSK